MDKHLTEPFQPYEGTTTDDAFDYGYDEPEPRKPGGDILWGRVAVLGAVVLFAFLIGRSTAGGGVSTKQFEEARAATIDANERIDELEAEVVALETQLNAEENPGTGNQGDGNNNSGDGENEGDATSEMETYVVASGDTLQTIAEQFYGDASLDDFLAEHNGISDPTTLQVGQKLEIPPKPE
ncbi:MAG: LysM peptidoglycan-binding domain-containing protein [Actinobacteria bacterium]|nr:LysM peptidoglycan-binding domain-containing protein [Actinomycetota bacterium]